MTDLTDPDAAFGKCLDEAYAVVRFFRDRNLTAKIYQCRNFKGRFPENSAQTYRGMGGTGFGHFVVVLDGICIDVTGKQFGADRLLCYPAELLNSEWEQVTLYS